MHPLNIRIRMFFKNLSCKSSCCYVDIIEHEEHIKKRENLV